MATSGPAVLYDAECGFCRVSVAILLRADSELVLEPVAIQSRRGGQLLAGMPQGDRLASAHCVAPDGTVTSGGGALAPVAGAIGRLDALAWAARRFPAAATLGYRLIAGNRSRFSVIATPTRLEWADRLIEARSAADAVVAVP